MHACVFLEKNVVPECPTVSTSMGSDPLRSLVTASDPLSPGKHIVSGPPELRLRNCFFRRPDLPFKLVCLISWSRRSLPREGFGAEPLRCWYCQSEKDSTGVGILLLLIDSTRFSSFEYDSAIKMLTSVRVLKVCVESSTYVVHLWPPLAWNRAEEFVRPSDTAFRLQKLHCYLDGPLAW